MNKTTLLLSIFFHVLGTSPSCSAFCPAVACPTCRYPNVYNFRFCQMCGYVRKLIQPSTHTPIAIDLTIIDVCLSFLEQSIQSTSYSKQKQSLQDELETFLCTLPSQKTLLTATQSDICRFLIWKD